MNLEGYRKYCLSKKGVEETMPFDEETIVFKVMGKMFALTNLTGPFFINLKCDPQKAIELRASYPAVIPGYHMNKEHWNTVNMDGSIDDDEIREWTDHSYDLVVLGLPKKLRDELI